MERALQMAGATQDPALAWGQDHTEAREAAIRRWRGGTDATLTSVCGSQANLQEPDEIARFASLTKQDKAG